MAETPDDDALVEGQGEERERSSIGFPYLDLDAAVEVARAVWDHAGPRACNVDELAGKLGMLISGAFRMKTATARTFGLLDKDARSSFRLTDVGLRIVQPETEAAARADAFLQVPLYEKLYTDNRNRLLPPARALEEMMRQYGVAAKQADKARHAFERSARQAGYFWAGENKLVRPKIEDNGNGDADPKPLTPTVPATPMVQLVAQGDDKLALIKMLVDRLPAELTNEKLAQWLRAAEVNLRWSHNVDGEIAIEVAKRDER